MLIEKVLIGFVVGTLIGMTGVGGGVLLLPVLIFVLKIPPIIAVGSDALFNFVTKIGFISIREPFARKSLWPWPQAASRDRFLE
jgi:uncharacterized protein